MDTRYLAASAGIDVGTLNVWVQRDLVPGVKIGQSGKKRIFGHEEQFGLMVLAELVRFGLSAPRASSVAAEINQKTGKYAVITQLPARGNARQMRVVHCDDYADVLRAISEPGAAMYAVMNVEMLGSRLHEAQAVWAQQQS